MIRRYRRLRARDERGFALVMLAGCLIMLVAAAGFAIDVGAWYLRSSQIQRAADAAALAGAAKMPAGDAAIEAAKAAAARNGLTVDNNRISATLTPIGTDQFTVQLKDNSVPLYFTKMFMGNLKIGRNSKAEFVDSVPMGSPFNALGMGDVNLGGTVPTQNYWLAVNGYCMPKEDGDLFLSRYDGTVEATSTAPGYNVTCAKNLPGSEDNADYTANGYDYIVSVPEAAGAVNIQLYDPAYSSHTKDPPAKGIRPSSGISPDRAKMDGSKVTTMYELWDTMGSASETDDKKLNAATFVTDDPLGVDTLFTLGTVSGHAGTNDYKYRVRVYTKANEANSTGVNAFGISAVSTSGVYCDARTSTTCPSVYGKNAISLFASLFPGGSGYVDLYLAKISGNYAGKKLQVALWDPGEGATNIRLLAPGATSGTTFTYQALPNPNTSYAGTTDVLNVGIKDVPTPKANRNNDKDFVYNDRLVIMGVQLPTGYVTSAGDGWWKLRYTLPSPVTERATWSAAVENGDPVHLVRNG